RGWKKRRDLPTIDAEHGMEGQLRRLPDDGDCLVGVSDPWEFNDDAAVARALERRFRHAELVDAVAEHLERPGDGVAVDALASGVLGLEDDLGPAPEIKAEPGGPRGDDDNRGDEDGDDRQPAPANR